MNDLEEDIRRIQMTGRSSFIISLPKKWVTDLGLRQGDQIVLTRSQGSTLTLIPRKLAKREADKKDILFTTSGKDLPDSISRKLIALYLNGYNTVRIKSVDGRFLPAQRDQIRESIKRKLVGTEIVTESPDEIVLQVLASFPELSVENTVRRMGTIANTMHKDAVASLKKLDRDLAREVMKMDDEVDRFSLYMVRVLKSVVQNDRLLAEVGLRSQRESLGYRVITKSVERIADHAAGIASHVVSMEDPVEANLYSRIQEMSAFAENAFNNSLKALFKRDYQLADEYVIKGKSAIELEREIIKHMNRSGSRKYDSSDLRLIIESLRRIAEYSSDIAEMALNITVIDSITKR